MKPKRLRYLSKGEIIILEYRIDKTFATFMNEVAEEQLKDGDENIFALRIKLKKESDIIEKY